MRPPTREGSSKPVPDKQRAAGLARRQYVRFAFYKIQLGWYQLDSATQAAHKRELYEVISTFNRRMLLRPYTLVGSRADTDILLWQIAESPQPFQELATAIRNTRMGAHLTMTHSYFSQTKRSIYEIRVAGRDGDTEEERLVIDPSEAKYVFVYPFIKTREWYQLSQYSRQGMMDEHIAIGGKYPSIRLNTTYSFGIDDYEFIVAFETDEPSDFLDLVQELRESTVSMYTLQDTPLFACTNLSLPEVLDSLGGPAIASEYTTRRQFAEWVDVCAVSEFATNPRQTLYYAGKMVAVFAIDGNYYAINNRCSHARGPLSEGTVDARECSVVCPWHYGKFDLRTGKAIDGVVKKGVERYDVRITNDIVQIRQPVDGEE